VIVDPASAHEHPDGPGVTTLHLSDAGGLTQFGAYLQTIDPGSVTSHRHWHSAEDEFLYVLDGEASVIDDDGRHVLGAGSAACWRHGDPNAHHVRNIGPGPLRILIAGSRAAMDICRYPDGDWMQVNGETRWQLLDDKRNVVREGELPPELRDRMPAWGKPFDPLRAARRYLRPGEVPPTSAMGQSEHGLPALGPYTAWPLSDEGGLTQFGAFTEALEPGSRSSHRHWHSAEDEFVYVLSGTVTLVEDDGPRDLSPGDCACWPAGVANAHRLENRGRAPVLYLVIGTRLPEDAVTYPDIDLHYIRAGGFRHLTRKDGTPLPGWPKPADR
jgi:uncharacterized cupin superfamily protein